ncbi:MAG: hypothetical protein WB870_02280 [Gallionellaceae bacterium]
MPGNVRKKDMDVFHHPGKVIRLVGHEKRTAGLSLAASGLLVSIFTQSPVIGFSLCPVIHKVEH